VSGAYVHGYHRRENDRLQDQAGTLVDLLHSDTSTRLEAWPSKRRDQHHEQAFTPSIGS
jgi:hypothetical protein